MKWNKTKENGIKFNRWYGFDRHPKRGTYGIVGETTMGYLFELGFDEDGNWVRAHEEDGKVEFYSMYQVAPAATLPNPEDVGKIVMLRTYNPFYRWKIVKQ